MDGKTLSATDALALQHGGYGYGMDGMGSWFWVFILIFLFRGNGFGYGEGATLNSEEFIKRDIFNTNQNVSTTSCQTQRDVLESKYDTQLAINNASAQAQACCCETNRNIDSVRYDTLLNFKDMQAQLSSCCCDLKNAVHLEAEATRNMIQENTIQDLRDRLSASQRETDTANLALQNNAQTNTILTSLGRYVTNPYVPYNYGYGYCGCGCGNTTIV